MAEKRLVRTPPPQAGYQPPWGGHRLNNPQLSLNQNFNINLKSDSNWNSYLKKVSIRKPKVNAFKANILYYNCRGLASLERRHLLDQQIQKIKWDIIGLSEIRTVGEKLIRKKNGDYFYCFGETKGYRGVGFLIKSNITNQILEIKGISERMCLLKIKINSNIKLLIVQVSAPHSGAEEKEVQDFYIDLGNILEKEKEYYTVVMEDLNEKVGKEKGEEGMWGSMDLGKGIEGAQN